MDDEKQDKTTAIYKALKTLFQLKSIEDKGNNAEIKEALTNNTERVELLLSLLVNKTDDDIIKAIGELKDELSKKDLSVTVESKPEVIRDDSETKEILLKIFGFLANVEMPKSIKISNSSVKDAIPVVLTDKDKKSFYNLISTVVNSAGKRVKNELLDNDKFLQLKDV